MSTSSLNKELVLELPNSQKLNFEAYGKNLKIPLDFMDAHNPSKINFRNRQFSIFTKLNSLLSSNLSSDLISDTLFRAMEVILVNMGANFASFHERMNKLNSIDCFSRIFEDQTILLIREELKKLFKTRNISIFYCNDTINTFDIYFDDISELDEVEPNPLEFGYSNNFFNIKNPDKIQVSVFINPNKIKNLYVFNDTDKMATKKKLVFDFTISTLMGLLSDQYRIIKTNQIKTFLNMVAELGKRGLSSSLISGFDKDIDKITGYTHELYKQKLDEWKMREDSNVYEHAFPKWADAIRSIYDYGLETMSFYGNPIYLYQFFGELSDFEIIHNIRRKINGIDVKGRGRLSTLMNRDSKASEEGNIYRATLATKRLLPYIYLSTYFVSEGRTFPVTTRINNAIVNSMTTAQSSGGFSVNTKPITNLVNIIKSYTGEYFKYLNNPIYLNKHVIKVLQRQFTYSNKELDYYKKDE